MDIRNITNPQIIQFRQNQNNNSATSDISEKSSQYKAIPLQTSKAYTSSQVKPFYKKTQTLNLPYLGEGEVYELSNGHKIILIPKEGQTVIHTYVGVGEADEPSNLKGGSHLLEHLVDDYCTNPKTNEVADILSDIGAECNAHVDSKYTGYYIKASITNADEFENLIKIQAQTLQNKNFTDKSIEDEKKIIIQELNSREIPIDDITLSENLTKQNLFKIKAIEGESVKDIRKDDLTNYYNKFYRPDNMVTTIIGPIDKNSILVVAKYFNNQVTQTKQTLRKQISPDDFIQKSIRTDVKGSWNKDNKAYINIGFVGPKNTDDKENCCVSVLRYAINKRINESTNADVYSQIKPTYPDKSMPSILSINGTFDERNVENDLHTIYSIMKNLRQNPISDEELKNIKKGIKSDWSYFAEDSLVLSEVYSEMGMLSQNLDRSKEFEYLDAITSQDVQNIAQKYLDLNKSSTVVVHPEESSTAVKEVSFSGNHDKFNSDDIKEYTLPNNLRVVIDYRPGIARSTVEFRLQSEPNLKPADNIAFTLGRLLDSEDNKKRFEQEGIDITINANPQEMSVVLNSDADRTTEILDSAVDILLKPNFSPTKFYINKILLERVNSKYNESQEEKIKAEISGQSPYFLNIGTNSAMEMNDVKDFHKQILQNAQGTVFITIPKEKLKDNQDKILKRLSNVPNLKPYNYDKISAKSTPALFAKTKVFLEPRDEEQLEIKKILKLEDNGNINYWATLLALNIVLGGNEKSKLYKQLRYEDRISYVAKSDVMAFQDQTISLTLSTKVSGLENGKNIRQAITAFDKSLGELATTPLTSKELKAAKGVMKSSILSQLEKSSSRNQMVSGGYNSSYGVYYQQALSAAIDNVTSEDIQNLAKSLREQPYLLAVSGNKDAIEANRQYLSSFGEVER